jgi:hypothetical protein
MELETVNKLYLELSQVATATTSREIQLSELLSVYVHAHRNGNSVPSTIEHEARMLLKRTRPARP